MILNETFVSSQKEKKDLLVIGGKSFQSRLLVGTGKYKNNTVALKSIEASGAEIITVAIRRLEKDAFLNQQNLMRQINWKNIWLLPNTAGSKTADEAIRIAFLGREIAKSLGQENNNFVKLEVIADSNYLMPDPIGTLKAAEFLVQKGFRVLPYINSDPSLAKHLEEVGCVTVMPLGSAIGSHQGLQSIENLQIIIENAKIPVIVDAGIGKPSDASQACELGAAAVLMNSVIAEAGRPEEMAKAMKYAVLAGRLGFLSKTTSFHSKKATPSSPEEGLFF